ncbi:MAG: DUF1080 domain-containing protein [Anaerolineaceae bacterium]|nr:DUF1080 domain-containing protein [Anaerolineaceae bacterium]
MKMWAEKGQGLAEYGLLITAVALGAVAILSLLGVQVSDVICRVVEGVGAESVCNNLLFFDDFSDDLENWRSFYRQDDNWQINDEENPQLCHVGDGGDFLLANESASDDYRIATKANITAGNGYGVLFRSSENENGRLEGYTFQYDPGYGGGQFIMRKWVNGYELYPPFAAARPPAGFKWHNQNRLVEIDVQGNTFTAFIDGEQVLVGQDDSYEEGGAGLRTWNGTQACFDNFSVQSK